MKIMFWVVAIVAAVLFSPLSQADRFGWIKFSRLVYVKAPENGGDFYFVTYINNYGGVVAGVMTRNIIYCHGLDSYTITAAPYIFFDRSEIRMEPKCEADSEIYIPASNEGNNYIYEQAMNNDEITIYGHETEGPRYIYDTRNYADLVEFLRSSYSKEP